ncbi:DUF922 domain-containing protein [Pseudahrensia aquimaris]|uniref:DUF922 domain-containing protein n=1 Tax=Pseudahrensia aquimaris TaxID=744461 RepID=A0ABW3FL27_9HYPH
MTKKTANPLIVGLAAGLFGFSLPTLASAEVRITEKTKNYIITGTNARDFARSMSKKGPYSRQHRKRAWATASRDLTFQITRKKSRSGCRVRSVKVSLAIKYVLPKLASTRGVSARERKKWKRMKSLLVKHERTHGRFYKELAKKTERSIKRMAPAKSCQQLERNALKLAKKLSAEDSARNDLFDARDSRNYRLMARIYGS